MTTTYALLTDDFRPSSTEGRIESIHEADDSRDWREVQREIGGDPARFVHLPMGGEVGDRVIVDDDGVARTA